MPHQRGEHEPSRGDAVSQSRAQREHQGEQQRHRDTRPLPCDRNPEERGVAAHGRQFAECEIDAADEAVDERIGRRQQGIDGDRRQGEQRMLQADGESARHRGRQRGTWNRLGVRRRALRLEPEAFEDLQPQLTERAGVRRHPEQGTAIGRGMTAAREPALEETVAQGPGR